MISEQQMNEALSRAKGLMGPAGDARVNQAAKRNANNFDAEGNYTQPAGSTGMRRMVENTSMGVNNNSKLPKAILESMMSNPIENNGGVGASVLDNLNFTPTINENVSAPQQPTYYAPPQPQYVQQPMMTVDYNYIRSIVNECIQASMQKIKEEILNESSLKLVRISNGNKIQLVDNKNNLYESTLNFKKNLNKE